MSASLKVSELMRRRQQLTWFGEEIDKQCALALVAGSKVPSKYIDEIPFEEMQRRASPMTAFLRKAG